jgi:hypothetical protein
VHCLKDFSLHLVNFISNNVLPLEENVLRNFIMLIHKLRAVDQYLLLVVGENGYARPYFPLEMSAEM